MGIVLVGGKHPDSLDDWRGKVPDNDYDVVATEMISGHKPSRKLLRAFYQPLSALVLLILNSKRFLIHNLFGVNIRQNDNRVASDLADENDTELLKIDASTLAQIETFQFKNEKTLIDWFNIYVLYHFFTSFSLSFFEILALVMLTLTVQLIASLWMYKNTRDQYMANEILENYDEQKELIALTGSLHTPAIAGYLLAEGITDIEVIGVPEVFG